MRPALQPSLAWRRSKNKAVRRLLLEILEDRSLMATGVGLSVPDNTQASIAMRCM